MTENEALRCVSVLIVFDRRNWSDTEVEAWTQALAGCTDAAAGMRASELLVSECNPRDWSLHRWLQGYRSTVAAAASRAPAALPLRDERHVSLEQHIATLTSRAEQGDRIAAAEVKNWARSRTGRLFREVA